MTWASRDKLNSLHLGGAVGVAVIIAVITQSWVLFVLVAAALVGVGLFTGEVRPPNGAPKNQSGTNHSRRYRP